MIPESLSKMNTSVMLHGWSDDEKMTFAWILEEALWGRRHMGTKPRVSSPYTMAVSMGGNTGYSQGMAYGHFVWSTFWEPWKVRLQMYFRAALGRVIVETKMKNHISVSSKERQWGCVWGGWSMVFGVRKP